VRLSVCSPLIDPYFNRLFLIIREETPYYNRSETDDSLSTSELSDMSESDVSGEEEGQYVTPEEDARNETIAKAMKLLLAARERVLTLSEQRVSTSAMNVFCLRYGSYSLPCLI
jgi:hypothetical protein